MISNTKKRLLTALTVTVLLVLALLGYAFLVMSTGIGIPCIFNKLLGVECAGCGISRAAVALLRFDIKAAFSHNLVWPLFVFYGVWTASYVFIRYVKYGEPPSLAKPLWLNYTVLSIIVTYGILRNFF